MIFRTVVATFLAVALLMPTQNASSAASILDNLVGSWKGRGIVTPNLGSKKENVRCRIQSTRAATTKGRLNIIGNCSVAGLLLPVNGWIKQKKASSKYTASLFNSLARISSNFFSGSLKGKRLRLGYHGVDNVTKEKIDASLTIVDKGGKNFDIQIQRTDPKTKKKFKVGTIKFAKRK